ncbi:MAG: phenylalanine--tRNA ligase subunit alpha [Acidimicrobiales bacterium]
MSGGGGGPQRPEDVLRPLEARLAATLAAAGDLEELEAGLAEALGRRSELAELQRGLGGRPAQERPAWGRALQESRARLGDLAAGRRADLEVLERDRQAEEERLDLTEVLPVPGPGHLHLTTRTRDALEDTFVGMGFVVAEGPEVETDWYNFEALNMPADHPARDAQDSFYLRSGRPGSVVLRTQTSPMQIRLMESQPPPIYAVVPGRAYRRDTADANHLPAFHQIEGLVVDAGVSFAEMAGTIDTFTSAFFGPGIRARLRPAYFPFTEPSAELDVTCTVCGGSGCRACSGAGWLELGGCGMVDPVVLENVGLDPETWSGFAFGFGIDRCAQMRWRLPDLRLLVENDMRFLAQV